MRNRWIRLAKLSLVVGAMTGASGCQSGTGLSTPKFLSSWRPGASSSSSPSSSSLAQNQLPKPPSNLQSPSPSATGARAGTWTNTNTAAANYQTGPYGMASRPSNPSNPSSGQYNGSLAATGSRQPAAESYAPTENSPYGSAGAANRSSAAAYGTRPNLGPPSGTNPGIYAGSNPTQPASYRGPATPAGGTYARPPEGYRTADPRAYDNQENSLEGRSWNGGANPAAPQGLQNPGSSYGASSAPGAQRPGTSRWELPADPNVSAAQASPESQYSQAGLTRRETAATPFAPQGGFRPGSTGRTAGANSESTEESLDDVRAAGYQRNTTAESVPEATEEPVSRWR